MRTTPEATTFASFRETFRKKKAQEDSKIYTIHNTGRDK